MPVHISPGAMVYSISVSAALQSQTEIGWEHLFRGFVGSDWDGIYAPDDPATLEDQHTLAIPRLATTIRALQDNSLALWSGRNTILHEHSIHCMAITSSQLNHNITHQMYNVSISLSEHLRSYFRLPLEARLRQSPRQRQRWLRLVHLASSHASSAGSRQQLISLFFP